MKQYKFYRYFIASLLLLIIHLPAQAGFKFGTSERIHFVANITLTGPQGERLYLGRKITENHFLMPYSIEDQGFVLGISGESKRYFPMPDAGQMVQLQKDGYLPNPLPVFEFSIVDQIFGHLLWLFLAGMALYAGYLFLVKKKAEIPTSARISAREPTFDEANAAALPPSPPSPPPSLPPDVKLPLTLHPSRRKAISLLAMAVMFVLAGVLALEEKPFLGWAAIIFFGLCTLAFGFSFRHSKNYLELHSDHFCNVNTFKKQLVNWRDIEGIGVMNVAGNKLVAWTYRADSPKKSTLNSSLTGFDATLLDNYGMEPEKLASLMLTIATIDAARQASEG